jgi:hypothetical protein
VFWFKHNDMASLEALLQRIEQDEQRERWVLGAAKSAAMQAAAAAAAARLWVGLGN